VPGPSEAATIVSAVSANAETFERAAEARADLLLVHHGLFWGSGVREIDAALKRRLQILFDSEIALAAYHLPLDAHPELGNNALIARALGAESMEPFAAHRGTPFGFLAGLPGEGMPTEQLVDRVAALTNREPLLLPGGPSHVRRLAIVSGDGGDYVSDAAVAGADALLTGEVAERATALAAELEVHVIAAGHHATETLGVQALAERLAQRFGLEHVFIDVRNPV
jgi:dinuclear metal center YbgI/SA1388 family protein